MSLYQQFFYLFGTQSGQGLTSTRIGNGSYTHSERQHVYNLIWLLVCDLKFALFFI